MFSFKFSRKSLQRDARQLKMKHFLTVQTYHITCSEQFHKWKSAQRDANTARWL